MPRKWKRKNTQPASQDKCTEFGNPLPDEIWLHIFTFLNAVDLCRVSQVCKRFETVQNDHILWLNLISTRFPFSSSMIATLGHVGKRKHGDETQESLKENYMAKSETKRNWNECNFEMKIFHKAHSGNVYAVNIDGPYAYSCSGDKTIRQFNIEDATCTKVFSGHTDTVSAFQIQNDVLVSGSCDKTLRLWNLASTTSTGYQGSLIGHRHSITCVQLNKDTAVSASWDATVRIWDIQKLKCKAVLTGHTDWIWNVYYEPDTDTIISASDDTTLAIWDVRTKTRRTRLTGSRHPITSFQIHNNILYAGSLAGLYCWDLRKPSVCRLLEKGSAVCSMQLIAPRLIVGHEDGQAQCWNVETQELEGTYRACSAIWNLRFHPDNGILVTAGEENESIIWNLEKLGEKFDVDIQHTKYRLKDPAASNQHKISSILMKDNCLLTGTSAVLCSMTLDERKEEEGFEGGETSRMSRVFSSLEHLFVVWIFK